MNNARSRLYTMRVVTMKRMRFCERTRTLQRGVYLTYYSNTLFQADPVTWLIGGSDAFLFAVV